MSFTRFSYDEERVRKDLQQSTDPGRYMLNVPGPGENMPMQDCPFIRLQKWGANYTPNLVHVENELRELLEKVIEDDGEKSSSP